MKRVLVVDDDADLRSQMEMFLESKGFEVLSAGNESDAIKLINEEIFDLAVLDLMMDNKDSGFVLSYKIKKKSQDIPVIMVSGVTKETGIDFNSAKKGNDSFMKVDAFISKDIRFEQLEGEINRLVRG